MALRTAACLLLTLPRAALARTPSDVMTCGSGAQAVTTASMTMCQYRAIADTVTGLWKSLSTSCTPSECQQADWAGCVLRVAGHDFMDFEGPVGGSDACTNLEADDNKGISACLIDGLFGKSLNDAYQPFCTTVSLADFFVIAAESMMMATRGLAADVAPIDFATSFRFGRTTAKACPGAGHRLPNPEGSCGEVERVFLRNMGLDWRGAAATMGVHTLGRARAENSGYDGWWSDPENSRRFNNNYYQSLLMNGWMPERSVMGNPGKNQWRRSDSAKLGEAERHQQMLNTDLCLAYDNAVEMGGGDLNAKTQVCCAWVFADTVPGVPGAYCGSGSRPANLLDQHRMCCDGNANTMNCARPEGGGGRAFAHILEFARNDGAWVAAFRQAWAKSTGNGFPNLQPLAPCEGPPPVPTGLPMPTTPGPNPLPPNPLPPNPLPTEGPPPAIPFDCAADAANWERGWSEDKKAWCCQHTGQGCQGSPAAIVFDCAGDAANWVRAWSEDQKSWCCAHTGMGCAGGAAMPAHAAMPAYAAGAGMGFYA